MPPLLGRFSTTNVVPSGLVMACAMMRATVSVGPGAYGTSRVMGLAGYCAAAVPESSAANAANSNFRVISLLLRGFLRSWRARDDSNVRPLPSEAVLYPAELRAPS